MKTKLDLHLMAEAYMSMGNNTETEEGSTAVPTVPNEVSVGQIVEKDGIKCIVTAVNNGMLKLKEVKLQPTSDGEISASVDSVTSLVPQGTWWM